jgi:hypothetical protein
LAAAPGYRRAARATAIRATAVSESAARAALVRAKAWDGVPSCAVRERYTAPKTATPRVPPIWSVVLNRPVTSGARQASTVSVRWVRVPLKAAP